MFIPLNFVQVFQRRIDGATDFLRGWDEYKNGFGDANHEFWLGNEKIHTLTSEDDNEMRVDMEDFETNTAYAKYQRFAIGNAEDDYRLDISGYSGNEGNSLAEHNGQPFSTHDHGNTYCAVTYSGAWWYDNCHSSNLNGLYLFGSSPQYAKGIIWGTWKAYYYSLKSTKMMIRRLAIP
ncbi:Microfibril-associated glycoprotein 4 [Mizuhopecten yessoensis]|uniref:Microfibril-associated glycoprotein 4 n=1 Tax=Mizuhopecten yessoensis TaxID=6573 RepID=A0A210Q0B5_MIZYE|nr:Microfibril-associated glycoprotein 4 [Mizuhopecten yessoensis]